MSDSVVECRLHVRILFGNSVVVAECVDSAPQVITPRSKKNEEGESVSSSENHTHLSSTSAPYRHS